MSEVRLYITGLTEGDTGKYTCETEIDGDIYKEETAILELFRECCYADLQSTIPLTLG